MLKKPWLHFLVLGLILFLAGRWAFPVPKPVLGPPNAARLQAMTDNYRQFSRDEVSPEVLSRFIDAELRDELLFREALQRGLQYRDAAIEQRIIRNMRFLDAGTQVDDATLIEQGYALRLPLTDEVIRRRLVQIMERLIVATARNARPTPDEIAARYRRDISGWLEPPLYTFSHVFLSIERADEMPGLIAAVEADQMNSEQARALGAPFLSGYEFSLQSADQMTRVFGAVFAEQLTALDPAPGDWVGPITSAFGQHYVFVAAVEPERTMPLEEASLKIEGALVREGEERAVDDWVDNAFVGYEVVRS
jgi:hypothetical protein